MKIVTGKFVKPQSTRTLIESIVFVLVLQAGCLLDQRVKAVCSSLKTKYLKVETKSKRAQTTKRHQN